jgi:hypothetical protein
MTSTKITDWLAEGTHANRPATPPVGTGGLSFYYETDTASLFVYNVAGSAWVAVGGGSSAGTVPTIVQSKVDTSGLASVTLGVAPTNGNLLVAFTSNPAVNAAGAGWTQKDTNGSGTDFGGWYTKVAGVGESTTQSPLNASPGGTGGIAMWELNGQSGTPYVMGNVTSEISAALSAQSAAFPNITNMIALGACALVSGVTFSNSYNMAQDQLDNTGNRHMLAMHSTLATGALAELVATFSGTGSYKAGICLITH